MREGITFRESQVLTTEYLCSSSLRSNDAGTRALSESTGTLSGFQELAEGVHYGCSFPRKLARHRNGQ